MAWLMVGGLLLFMAALVVSIPLIFGPIQPYAVPPPADAAYSERDALLEAMSELEISYRTGKLTDHDYDAQKAELQRQYLAARAAAPPAS